MRKLSIILIMALILGLVPLFSFASKASANRFPTIFSASLESSVYFVGNIPSGKGIVKVQVRNSIYDPDQFHLENLSKEGISKLKTTYETIDFYLFPATTISKDTQVIKIIDTYNYNKITDVPIPETIIHAGQLNNLDIYTSKDITLKLSSKPTNMNKFVVAPFMEDNWFLNWFIYFCKPFGDGKINSDGEVTFHDVPLGTWWFAPMKFGDDESWSYTFGARVKVEPTVNNPDLTQEIIAKPKKPSGKFDIRDVVTLSNQATGNEQEGYFFSNMIYGVRTQVIDDSHYFDSWFRK